MYDPAFSRVDLTKLNSNTRATLGILGALLLIAARHSLFLKASFNKSEYDLTYFCNSVSDIKDVHASPRRSFGFPLSKRGKSQMGPMPDSRRALTLTTSIEDFLPL